MSRRHQEPMRILIGEIVAGVFGAGDQLPRETALAEQFGVSRGVAREFIRALEERGLVRVTHGRGATVTAREHWEVFDPDVLAAVLRAPNGARVLVDYLECRRILEVEAAGLAAKRAKRSELAALTTEFERMSASAELAARTPEAEELWYEADIAFHRAIAAATGNAALGRLIEPIHRALATVMPQLARPGMRIDRALPEHKAILEAIRNHDPKGARDAMAEHLATVERYLAEYARGRRAAANGRRKARA